MIHKIRYGYATNSSSSHSVVVIGGSPPRDDIPDDFGWEDFTLATPSAKKLYLDSQWAHARGEDPDEIEGLMHVDHQSVWTWPKDRVTGEPSEDFYKILKKEIEDNPNVLILGGNDNGGEHILADGQRTKPLPLWECLGNGHGVVRKDPGGWLTYLGHTYWSHPQGFKLRFGPGNGKKSALPELIDLKITDHCGYGCKFCYQGSTPKGKHATDDQLKRAVKVLGDLQVMEVAIGGGEPTDHPGFLYFTKQLKQAKIVPNATTKNSEWVAKRNRWGDADGLYGIGLSINSAKEIQKWGTCVYHVVMGVTPMEEVRRILLAAPHVLLLDFKTTGRGAQYPQHDYSELPHLVRSVKQLRLQGWEEDGEPSSNWSIGFDTPLAKRFQEDLRGMGIPEVYYETEEGKHSAYWDLVGGKFGPSSYDPDKLVKVPPRATAKWFSEVFATW